MDFKKYLWVQSVKNFLNKTDDDITEVTDFTEETTIPASDESTKSTLLDPSLDILDKDNFMKWTITNCHDPYNAIKFVSSENILLNEEIDYEKTLFVQITTQNNFEELKLKELREISKVFSNRSTVILFMSQNCESFIIAWKSKDIDYFLTLKSFTKEPLVEYKELYKFIIDFLIHSLSIGHIGLQKGCVHRKNMNKIDLFKIADSSNFNLIQLCTELGEIQIVKILLKLDIISDEPNHPTNAQTIAFHENQFDILLAMLQSNYTYPQINDINKCPSDIRNFLKNSEEIHEAIKLRKFDKIGEILRQSPKQIHFFNLRNESALKTCLFEKSYDIYEILLANGMTFGTHENFNEIFGRLSKTERKIVRKIHLKHLKDLPENYMNIIMMNTFISPDELKKEDKEIYIRRAYKVLDQHPNMSVLLQIVAASRRFKIIFDFKRDSVQLVDVTVDSNTKGSFCLTREICIGAKQLLNPKTENETIGTLAHELCHFAVNLTYNNLAKPYLKGDSDTKEEYKEIVEQYRDESEDEDIVKYAYQFYSSNMLYAELIVRVPHLLAFYHNNPKKLKEVQDKFKCLFEFFVDKVIPDMKKAISRVKAKSTQEMAEKDKQIQNFGKKFCISMILIFIIGIFISSIYYEPNYEYSKLSLRDKIKLEDSTVSYKGVNLRLRNLFYNNFDSYDNLMSDQIKRILNGEIVAFDSFEFQKFQRFFNFSWNSLPDNLRIKVLQSKLLFQNETILFKDLRTKVFNSLSPPEIDKILNGETLKVGNETKIDSDFYIERKFILEDSKMLLYRSKNPELEEEYDLEGTQQFYEFYMNKSFEFRAEIFDEIRKNIFYKFESDFYDLNNEMFKSMIKDSYEIIQLVEKERTLLLSSEPGAGKTITFQTLAKQIKHTFPTRWVFYIDLKDYTKLYVSKKSPKEMLEDIIGLNNKNSFEMRIFQELYKVGEVIFIWNGYDEIAPTYSFIVMEIFKLVQKSTRNIQCICTRTIYSNELSVGLKFSLWQLVPFEEFQRRHFLKEYLVSKKVDSEDINENVDKFLTIIKKLSDDGYSTKKFNTPLLLRLVAEVYEDQEMLDSVDLYGIYEKFVDKKLELWSERGKIVNKMIPKIILATKFSMKEIYQKYGLLNGLGHLSSSNLNFKIRLLEIMKKKIPEKIPYDEISRMGIVYINGENNFQFGHRTFAEFFIAQYFIDNLYNADDDENIEDVELRLELFFILTKRYGSYQKIITDFILSYLDNENPKDIKMFCPAVKKLLKEKFNRLFLSLLDVDTSDTFIFLIKFFKKDHELLADLLHVNDDKTLFTEIFNPNNFASYINPNLVKNWTQNILTPNELKSFTTGKNQKGVILYGIHFYRLINESKEYNTYDDEIKALCNTNFIDFFVEVKSHLNDAEQKQLFLSAASPKIYLFYDKFFNTSFIHEYKRLWTNYEMILSKDELKDLIGYALSKYIEVHPFDKDKTLKNFFLTFLLKKAEFLNNSQIFDMYLTNSFLHEIHFDYPSFEILWYFLLNHTTFEERKQILLADDYDDHNYYFYWSHENTRKTFSTKLHSCFFYDFAPFKIFHRAFSSIGVPTFDLTTKIYNDHFNNSEIRKIIYDSNYSLLYSVGTLVKEDFSKFRSYLDEVFKGSEIELLNYINKEIKHSKLSVLDYTESFREIAGSQSRWFDNLQILYDLGNKTLTKIGTHSWFLRIICTGPRREAIVRK